VGYVVFPSIFGEGVRAFFTGREPGIEVASLTGGRPLYMPRQKHTGRVVVLGPRTGIETADSVITALKGTFIGVQVADCVPMLLHDPARGAIAAVHAGWRGTAQGILKRTVRAMAEEFGTRPADLLLAVGPAIRGGCYEVGPEVLEAVAAATGEGQFHTHLEGRLCLDLPAANRLQALSEGLREENVWVSEECTSCLPDRFHSYRHGQSGGRRSPVGRQGGFIAMT